jgi:acetyltransferase-like isoleucine patch superfamily enzyme
MFILERLKRFKPVREFAWEHSLELAKEEGKGSYGRLAIFIDMLIKYLKYGIWTDQYLSHKFNLLPKAERQELIDKSIEETKKRDEWHQDFVKNRKFLIKYSNIKYEEGSLRRIRSRAYAKRYGAGKRFFCEYDVHISRQHYLDGTIKIGNHVLLAKHAFLDYSGELIIHDYVKITAGVCIETHSHPGFTSVHKGVSIPGKLEIFEHVSIGTNSIVTESCHIIGRHAKIGAGSVVRRNIPPYAIVVGNPAKIIGFIFTPEEMEEFEKKTYAEKDRTSVEKFTTTYNKYYKSRVKEIKEFLKS